MHEYFEGREGEIDVEGDFEMNKKIVMLLMVLAAIVAPLCANGISEQEYFNVVSQNQSWSLVPVSFAQVIIKSSQVSDLYNTAKAIPLTPPQSFAQPNEEMIMLITSYSDSDIDRLISRYFEMFTPTAVQDAPLTYSPTTLYEFVDQIYAYSKTVPTSGPYITDEELNFMASVFPAGWMPNKNMYEKFRFTAKELALYMSKDLVIPANFQFSTAN